MNFLKGIYEDGVVKPHEHDELMVMLKKNFQLRAGGLCGNRGREVLLGHYVLKVRVEKIHRLPLGSWSKKQCEEEESKDR